MNNQSGKMPVMFVGHGNPIYAITNNVYREKWKELGKNIESPGFIVCISAHWYTRGTFVCVSEKPETIHDFGGFPEELYQVDYPVPGAPEIAGSMPEKVKGFNLQKETQWGLDHGAWSILMNMFPEAVIPVFQISIDFTRPPEYHFRLGKELSFLRKKGGLVIGSGNIVHNLRMAQWDQNPKPWDWAVEFEHFVKDKIEINDFDALVNFQNLGGMAKLAHPTEDHYLPLLYILGMVEKSDRPVFFNQGIDMASMSMLSVQFS